MSQPFFSVVMPVYNGLPYLAEVLESLRNQTFKDFEVIAVDDLSKDGSHAFLQEYAKGSEFPLTVVQVPSKPNICTARVRNHGLRRARGAWIAFLDQDDLWLPEKLAEHHRAALANPGAGFIHDDMIDFDSTGDLNRGRIADHPFLDASKVSGRCFEALFDGDFVGMSSASLPKRIFDELGPMDESLSAVDDYEIWLRASAKYPVVFIDRPLTRYRNHAANMTKMDILVDQDLILALKKTARNHPHLVPSGRLAGRLYFLYNSIGERLRERGHHGLAGRHFLQAAANLPFSYGAWFRAVTCLTLSLWQDNPVTRKAQLLMLPGFESLA